MKTACDRRSRNRGCVIGLSLGKYAFVGAGVLSFLAGTALAGPEGAQVARGQASITQQGATTLIQAGHNSIINYSSFNIAGHETVRFIQPDASSRVLNRIHSAAPTQIDGSLLANGIVYLVNPAGVMFGKDSIINVGGIYAAAGNISDANFMAGIDHFTNLQGAVVNHGTINAGVAHLIGKQVANNGVVIASDAMTMVAGNDVYIGDWNGRILVKVDAASEASAAAAPSAGAAVQNTGQVRARRFSMAAGDVYSLAISNTGTVAAQDIQVQGGARGEVSISGTLDASSSTPGQAGGRVEVLGDRVAVRGARIDASGPAGGGTVLVGGDYQGKGDVPNARATSISSDSVIRADATQQGDGGRVIIWSDQRTGYAGHISARGGPGGGDGGFAEVSGKEDLMFAGTADLGSSHGRGGALLLDPRDITIATGGSAVLTDVDQFADGTGTDVTIAPSTITAVTNTGTAVTLQASRDINVNNNVITDNPGGDGGAITMQAGRSILIGNNVTINTDNGNLTLRANENLAAGVVDADRHAGAGVITMGTGAALNVGTGTLTVHVGDGAGLTESTSGDITIRNLTASTMNVTNIGPTAGSGVVFPSAVSGVGTVNIVVRDGIDINNNFTTTGPLTLNADGNSDGTGTITLATNADVSSGSANMSLTAGGFSFGNNNAEFITTGHMDITYTGAAGIGLGTSTVVGGLNFADSAAGLGHFVSPSYTWSTPHEIRVGALNRPGQTWYFNAGSTVTIEGAATTLGGLLADAVVGITANSQLNVSGQARFRTRNDAGADITVANAASTFGTLVAESRNAAGNADSAGTITIQASGALDILALRTSAGASVTTTGAITDSGPISIGGAASFKTLNNGGAAITLDHTSSSFGTLSAQSRNAADDADAAGSISIFSNSAVDLASLRTTGNASITATGAINDLSDLVVGGTATFHTRNDSGASITLDNATSSFGALAAEVRTASGATEAVADILIDHNGPLTISSLRTGGSATVFSLDSINATGVVGIGGGATFQTRNNAGGDITLNNAANVFNGPISAQARNAANDDDAAGNISIFTNTAANLFSLRTAGNASVTATGAITDSGALVIGGAGTFHTRNNSGAAITLDHAGSSFGSIAAEARTADNSTESTGAITLITAGGLDLASLRTGGNATVTAGGTITDSGAVAVGGAAAFKTLHATGADITLDHASNAFGTISAQSRDAADSADRAGTITIFENSAMNIAGARTTGNASFTATGAISDSGALVIGGQGAFKTRNNTAQSIVLGNAGSSFGSISAQTRNNPDNADVAGTISIFQTGAMVLKNVRTAGNAAFTATGAITDAGPLVVGGAMSLKTLSAGVAGITLADTGSSFGSISAQARNLADTADAAGNITIFEDGPMNLASIRTLGNASLTATGAITDSGSLVVGGAASFRTLNNAGAAITLDEAGSSFGTVSAHARDAADAADAAGAITLQQTGTMTLAGIGTTSTAQATAAPAGTMNVVGAVNANSATLSADTLNIAAAINASGGITLQPTTAGRTIGLNDAAGGFNLSSVELGFLNTAGTVTIGAANSGAISIGSLGATNLTAGGHSLTLRGGAVTFSNGITLANDRTMTFQTGAINGSNPAVDVTIGGAAGTVVFNTSGAVDIDTNVARLGASGITGALDLDNGAAALAVTGPVTATGAVTLTTDSIDIGAAVGGSAITLQPFTANRTIGLNDASGDFNLSAAELAFLNTTGQVTIGRSSGTGAITIGSLGAIDLSAETYSMLLRGGVTSFTDTLRLGSNTTLTLATGAVTGSGGLDVRIDGASGGVAFDTTGAVGSSGTPINTQVRNLAATTTTGGVFVQNTGALNVSTVNGRMGVSAGGGDIDIVADGPLNINQALATTGAGSITVLATGGNTGDLNVNATVTTQNGGISLSAHNDVNFAAAGDVTSTAGNIAVTADADLTNTGGAGTGGALTMADGTLISTGGTIALSADGNVAIGGLSTTNTTAAAVSVTSAAGDITDAGDAHTDIVVSGAGGAATLTATAGRVGGAGNALDINVAELEATGQAGINLANFSPALTAVLNSSGGTATLNTTGTLTTGGAWSAQTFDLLATDVTIAHAINASNIFAVQRTSPGSIGIGAATGDMTLSSAELQLVTAGTFSIGGGSTTSILVDNIAAGDMAAPTFLLATGPNGSIAFSGAASTFHSLTARANDGIAVDVGLATATGDLTLNGDFDTAAGINDSITFAPGLTIASAGSMTLSAQTGGMSSTGGLRLDAASGITLNNSLTLAGAGQLNADSDASGAGTLTINPAATLSTGGAALDLLAADLVLNGFVNAGAGQVSLSRPNGGSIGLGATAGDMTVNGAELQRITAGSLHLGSSDTTLITVNGIAAGNSANIAGDLVLDATGAGGIVQFESGASAFSRLIVNAAAGVIANADLSTTGPLTIDADTDLTGAGTLSVASGATVSSGGSAMSITAADLALDGSLNAGAGDLTILGSANRDIGLGATAAAGGLNISGAELGRITAANLILGSATDGGSIIVDGITAAQSNNIAGLVTLNASGAGSNITFQGGTSTFRSLDARADNGIVVNANITTSQGLLSLNGDLDNAADSSDAITIGAGRTLTAAGLLRLAAQTGGIGAGGDLTLVAGDLALEHRLDVPGNALTIRRSSAGTIGLGDATGDMTISRAELERMHVGSLTVGGDQTTLVSVDNVTAADSANISGLVSLLATGGGGRVEFINNASTFGSLSAAGNDGILVGVDLSTNAGGLTLNGDFNDAVDGDDRVRIAGDVTIASGGALTVTAASGGILLTGAEGTTVTMRSTDDQSLTLGSVNAADNASLTVTSQGAISLGGVNLGSGDFSATADANSNGIVNFNVANIVARDITLAAGNDANDTISFLSDLIAGRHLTVQNAGTVAIGNNVNLSAGGAISMASGVNQIRLDGEANSSNTFSGGAGQIIALGPISANNSINLTINSRGDVNVASASVNAGTLTLLVDSDNTGTHSGTFGSLTAGVINATGTGGNDTLTFNGPVNATLAGGISVNAGAIILGANMTASAGGLDLEGSIAVQNDATLSTGGGNGNINLLGPVNGANVLTVSPGTGNVLFTHDVGGSTGLRGLVIPNSGSVRFNGLINIGEQGMSIASNSITLNRSVSSVGDINFAGPVVLTSDIVIDVNDITFGNILNSDGTPRSLVINSTGDGLTAFSGVVGGLSPLARLTTNADGATRIAADIFTTGGMLFQDRVILGADVRLQNTGAGGITFASMIDSDAPATPRSLTLLVDTTATGLDIPLIVFGGNIGSVARLQNLFLNYHEAGGIDGRSSPGPVATIVARQIGADGLPLAINASGFNPDTAFSINVANQFIMGLNEKFTALGNLSITAGTQARLGDLAALRDLAVTSPNIRLRGRERGSVLTTGGTVEADRGLDFVARRIAFSTNPVVEGVNLPVPIFTTENGVEDVNGTLGAFAMRAFGPFKSEFFVRDGRVLDVRSEGPSSTNIAPTIAGAVPRESQSGDVSQDTSVGQAQRDQLTTLGIFARDLTLHELMVFLVGRSIYDDYPDRVTPSPVPGDYKVAIPRLSADRVQILLDTYDKLVNQAVYDEDGRLLTDQETGRPLREPRTDEIRDNLTQALREFRRADESRRDFEPAAFRAFLEESPEHSAALADVRGFQDLLRQLSLIGLTPLEFNIARDMILQYVTPRGMRISELEGVITATQLSHF